jgi:site-specific DNA recombinase
MTNGRRCAIYTRKSTEEGLEQDFNSLDAQREACEAYIRSQRQEGWHLFSDRFDDGGYSGGNMSRPALTRLLAAAREGRIETVVVYKVDRLTRSLADFARMVELFDQCGVSFVSVTQQFNTTTSMGRLTLNVLLSFAQFEREVTGERIRDKIAASKKKGMWMGGLAPLGYDARDRSLIINPAEAETVRTLYRLYLEVGTVRRLKEAAERLGLGTKQRQSSADSLAGGRAFTRGHLYQLLSNRTYAGDVVHKGISYPGRHEAIIARETFDAVQGQLTDNAACRRSPTNSKAKSLLTGLAYDETGDRLCPTHANKKGRRYRYYISKRLMHRATATHGGWRVPARELEGAVKRIVAEFLRDELRMTEALQLKDTSADRLRRIFHRAAAVADELQAEAGERQRLLLSDLLERVTLGPTTIRIEVRRSELGRLVATLDAEPIACTPEPFGLYTPIQLQRRGVEAKLVMQFGGDRLPKPDARLVAVIADAHRWVYDLAEGRAASVRDLAQQNDRDAADISRTLPLAFLAPAIVEAILEGRQPVGLTPRGLERIGMLPHTWDDQRRRLGFPT